MAFLQGAPPLTYKDEGRGGRKVMSGSFWKSVFSHYLTNPLLKKIKGGGKETKKKMNKCGHGAWENS